MAEEERDARLTGRARRMAEWLCDASDTAQQSMFREASVELLLRELPEHWTAEEIRATSAELRMMVGPRASRCAWLAAINWLVGEEERLPPRPPHAMSVYARDRAQQHLKTLLATLNERRSVPRREARVTAQGMGD